MLKCRLITAFILIPIVITALFLLSQVGFTITIFAVCMLSAWEWGQLAGLSASTQRIWLAILYGLLLILMILTASTYHPFVNVWQAKYVIWAAMVWWLVALLLVLYYPRSAVLWRGSILLRLLFGILTIFPFFWSMLVLRQYHYDVNRFIGAWWLLYVMILVWGADTGAYIFGRVFGRHKLAPKVSPGKTWEGLIGGLFTSTAIAWLLIKYISIDITSITIMICSVITTLASVLGDLTESMFKREAGIKDSGYLIPGHGGILDRIDGLTAAVPVFVCLALLIFNAI